MATDAEVKAMERALELAGRGGSHPNPCVGALLLSSDGGVLAEGVTDPWPGLMHAERAALAALGTHAAASTLVVTLEPCTHTGRSGPCTEAILGAGIDRVVVGALDPDPRAGGAGVARLQSAGVDVEVGVLAADVEAADPAYFHHRRTGRPRFLIKSAVTIDGQTAARDGTSRWITSPEAREDTHRLRAGADAVMVGAGTVRADDPLLSVRTPGYDGPQPAAVVVAGRRDLPPDARLWERPETLVYATRPLDIPVEVVEVEGDGRPRLAAVAADLGERGLLAVLVEGGAELVHGLWQEGLVDGGVTYVGALAAGGAGIGAVAGAWDTLSDAHPLEIMGAEPVGPDIKVTWTVRESGADR